MRLSLRRGIFWGDVMRWCFVFGVGGARCCRRGTVNCVPLASMLEHFVFVLFGYFQLTPEDPNLQWRIIL